MAYEVIVLCNLKSLSNCRKSVEFDVIHCKQLKLMNAISFAAGLTIRADEVY